jgi:lysophospholipase L1-like esterase
VPGWRKPLKRFITQSLLSVILSGAALAQSTQVTPVATPPQLTPLPVSIGGRVLTTTVADRRFGGHDYTWQWPGIYFESAFRGTEVFFRIGAGDQDLHITLDNATPMPLISPAPGIYRVSALTLGPHQIRIDVISESQDAPNTFGGFAITREEKPLNAPHRRRQIEFIGDSHTVGYGNTSSTRTCSTKQVWSATDTSQVFGALVARHYDADYQINAISGRGIVRNYDGSVGDPLPVAWPWVLFDKKNLYSDTAWQPEVIVISLGTNDFTTALHSGEKWKTRDQLHADYEATYLGFLQTLRARDPHAYFILWATDMEDGEIESEVQKVVDHWKARGETRVAFLPINGLTFTGCHFHPSIVDDRTIADRMEKTIDTAPDPWLGNESGVR